MTTEPSITSLPSRFGSRWIVAAVVVASVALHGVAYGALSGLRKPAKKKPPVEEPVYAKPKPKKRYVVEVKRPPKPVAEAPKAAPRKLERLERRRAKPRPQPRTQRAVKRPVRQAARTPKTLDLTQQPPRAGVNATLTAAGGSEAYAVGSTAQGDPAAPPGKRPRKKTTRSATPAPAPASAPAPAKRAVKLQVTKMPRVLSVPRVAYPKRAKDKRIQGTVKLSVTISTAGRVVRVRVVSGLGYGLDQAALRALKRARFEPARAQNGQPMTYTIRYRYRFRLED